MTSTPDLPPLTIPVLLLKTRSHPHDAYEEYFGGRSAPTNIANSGQQLTSSIPVFLPEFVPVLEHRRNVENLETLERLLGSGELGNRYGGMIFTSQRAVEAWAEVVKRVERVEDDGEHLRPSVAAAASQDLRSGMVHPKPPLLDDDFTFPFYTVGPATSRALDTLVDESSTHPTSPFTKLRPQTCGSQTGNGEALAQYILHHYNTLHSQLVYTFYEAPRLPFTPLIGPPRGERVEKNDERLRKKPLLFLVGEQRRDIIPRTLTDVAGELSPEERILVDEVEVYVTATKGSFQDDFRRRTEAAKEKQIGTLGDERDQIIVVVVFSPQGCEAMLRPLGFLNDQGKLTEVAKKRWERRQAVVQREEDGQEDATASDRANANITTSPTPPSIPSSTPRPVQPRPVTRYIIATIGPTTRDYLSTKFGFEADVCAAKPSPNGLGDGILEFLKEKDML